MTARSGHRSSQVVYCRPRFQRASPSQRRQHTRLRVQCHHDHAYTTTRFRVQVLAGSRAYDQGLSLYPQNQYLTPGPRAEYRKAIRQATALSVTTLRHSPVHFNHPPGSSFLTQGHLGVRGRALFRCLTPVRVMKVNLWKLKRRQHHQVDSVCAGSTWGSTAVSVSKKRKRKKGDGMGWRWRWSCRVARYSLHLMAGDALVSWESWICTLYHLISCALFYVSGGHHSDDCMLY
jgi:hypothetical protein